jgi:hypothetical protein
MVTPMVTAPIRASAGRHAPAVPLSLVTSDAGARASSLGAEPIARQAHAIAEPA